LITLSVHTNNELNCQITRAAAERDAAKRAAYMMEIADYEPEQLIFTDESYCDKRNTSRLTGWSKAGTRVCADVPFLRGRRYVHELFYISYFLSSCHAVIRYYQRYVCREGYWMWWYWKGHVMQNFFAILLKVLRWK
jgi:hypothetical protein